MTGLAAHWIAIGQLTGAGRRFEMGHFPRKSQHSAGALSDADTSVLAIARLRDCRACRLADPMHLGSMDELDRSALAQSTGPIMAIVLLSNLRGIPHAATSVKWTSCDCQR
jgi:hypothetical protein